MKRFEFNLQAVLTLRQREEQKALKTYGKELVNREQARVRLLEVDAEMDSARNDARAQFETTCPAFKLLQTQSSLSMLSERRQRCARQLLDIDRRVQTALKAMLALRQKRRVVDLYHEKRRVQYDQEVLKLEQKQLDELAGSNSHSRRFGVLASLE